MVMTCMNHYKAYSELHEDTNRPSVMHPRNKAWSKGKKAIGPDLGNRPEVTYVDFTPEYVVLPTLTVLVLTIRGCRSHANQMDQTRTLIYREYGTQWPTARFTNLLGS